MSKFYLPSKNADKNILNQFDSDEYTLSRVKVTDDKIVNRLNKYKYTVVYKVNNPDIYIGLYESNSKIAFVPLLSEWVQDDKNKEYLLIPENKSELIQIEQLNSLSKQEIIGLIPKNKKIFNKVVFVEGINPNKLTSREKFMEMLGLYKEPTKTEEEQTIEEEPTIEELVNMDSINSFYNKANTLQENENKELLYEKALLENASIKEDIGNELYRLMLKVLKENDSISIPKNVYDNFKVSIIRHIQINSTFTEYKAVAEIKFNEYSVYSMVEYSDTDDYVRVGILKPYGTVKMSRQELVILEDKYIDWKRRNRFIYE